ncbi:MAG TPA: bi-domain-containing oxidoreductase [Candidatus Dormibacteraeota bacterium]|nr:bi-domain-containing oxidoreductase [Candidatus Dormibacteraeota bacterium]
MLQITQYQKTGEISVDELPAPKLRPGSVLVRNVFSLISAGTERTSVETAQASMLQKARSRPDLVRQVLDNFNREGLLSTYKKVRERLDNFKELGYSCAGVVVESAVDDIKVGDRVACAGVGYASHAEIVSVPRNLVVKVPDEVGFDEAAFTTVCAIAMQGVRQADVRVGEQVAVIGLGLIGLITVELLKASGCRVIGMDISSRNFDLALTLGCDQCAISNQDAALEVQSFTRGYGADAVVITAATTSNEPVELAIQCARKRGTVVAVGAVGMNLPRSPFYEKEINFRMSCSYGPGRYDPDYEERGQDYPLGFVRWTENRNMEAALDMMAQRKLNVAALITHRIPVEESLRAYDIITGKVQESYLGILIQYPDKNDSSAVSRRIDLQTSVRTAPGRRAILGLIGAGNFTQSVLMPPLKKLAPRLRGLATAKPVNARKTAEKYKFEFCATDATEIINDKDVNLVFVTSRHDSHARYVTEALRAGKSVFVEKPLALNHEELEAVLDAYSEAEQAGSAPLLMVGYNRRFSEPVRAIQQLYAGRTEPLAMHYRVNAGFTPSTHWMQQPDQGGRFIGEGGHFVDVMQFLCGALPISVYAVAPTDGARRYNNDNVLLTISFADGSVGTIHYLANGASTVEKEYIEVFGESKTARMWNFKKLECAVGGKKSSTSFSGDKGHAAEMRALLDGFESDARSPISVESLAATSRLTFAAMESLRSDCVVRV